MKDVAPNKEETLDSLRRRAGVEWFDYQLDCFDLWDSLTPPQQRLCLYYRTGAGKSLTALACMALSGYHEVLVIAPPSTQDAWRDLGAQLGVEVTVVSHAKFRMADFKVERYTPVIADEFHMFGGHQGQGWKKLAGLANGLQAPLILCSATPNYNDAERCYCVQKLLDPHSVKGGFLEFLYKHCTTEPNFFGQTPKVTGFQKHADAAGYLSSLPHVVIVPDITQAGWVDIPLKGETDVVLEQYGLNQRRGEMAGSIIGRKHAASCFNIIGDDGLIRDHIYETLIQLAGEATTPVLVYSWSAVVGIALFRTCDKNDVKVALITGKSTPKEKKRALERFRDGQLDVLIGTDTLATGTDGLDKVCDTMITVCDTQDDALRRQLMGRILPRGVDSDESMKQFYRLQYTE